MSRDVTHVQTLFDLLQQQHTPNQFHTQATKQKPATKATEGTKLQALVYDILPSRRKVPESDARSVRRNYSHRTFSQRPTRALHTSFCKRPRMQAHSVLLRRGWNLRMPRYMGNQTTTPAYLALPSWVRPMEQPPPHTYTISVRRPSNEQGSSTSCNQSASAESKDKWVDRRSKDVSQTTKA